MKVVFLILFVVVFAPSLKAQKADEVLATANGLTFTTNSLSESVRKNYVGRDAAVAAERTRLLTSMINETVLEAEAKSVNSTGNALIAAELKKVAEPTAAEIKTIFDANKAAFGDKSFDQVRPQIVAFLRNNAQQKAMNGLAERLKTKYKFVAGKDINAADVKPADTLFSIAGKTVTAGDFTDRYNAQLYDVKAAIAVQTVNDLENSIFSTLIEQEAKARSIEVGDLIAAEITDKLREFSDEERFALQDALRKKLFEKYSVKIAVKEPEPVAHNVSADDDPFSGKAEAPVTVIMFSDFQCSACSATHPVLKRALAAYGGNVRLVVRDFPLESVHENAFHAALAANAARAQGKFFEYVEILYRSQDSLDDASLKRFAAELGLNAKQFELDFISEKTAAEVRKDMGDGDRNGVRSTPTIFINGIKAQRFSEAGFRSMIDRALSRPK
ncbi:MAG: thioredoxin domain-containing protein [Acidobacteria bacterium]|nr:thioredoxin domain-containing protein [Acidobacteriota bacterium]